MLNGFGVTFPNLGNPPEQGRETRTTIFVCRGEVGPREKRLLVGGQEDRHGPAPLPVVQRECGCHVNLVEVGPLLPVNLDADEVFVHQCRNRLILERLAFHDMAPVACGIADTEEDGAVFFLGMAERLLPPCIPVDRIMGVL
jgi:hypothetical protein